MFKQIAEFYGLYVEKELGEESDKKWVLGDHHGGCVSINIFNSTKEEFRSLCEQMSGGIV
jgi:hypothetical protein